MVHAMESLKFVESGLEGGRQRAHDVFCGANGLGMEGCALSALDWHGDSSRYRNSCRCGDTARKKALEAYDIQTELNKLRWLKYVRRTGLDFLGALDRCCYCLPIAGY